MYENSEEKLLAFYPENGSISTRFKYLNKIFFTILGKYILLFKKIVFEHKTISPFALTSVYCAHLSRDERQQVDTFR